MTKILLSNNSIVYVKETTDEILKAIFTGYSPYITLETIDNEKTIINKSHIIYYQHVDKI